MGKEVTYVDHFPKCDFCDKEARYDGAVQTQYGRSSGSGGWAYMCEDHFKENGVGLGVGLGQRLHLRIASIAERHKQTRECVEKAIDQCGAGIKGPECVYQAAKKCEPEFKTVTMTMDQLEESVMDSVWYPTCPWCGSETGAEPDARMVYCDSCGKKINIINPFY